MDLSKQTERAATIHTRYLLSGEATCIDCHKGIAHELPNMEGVDPGWKVPPELGGRGTAGGFVVRCAGTPDKRSLASERSD